MRILNLGAGNDTYGTDRIDFVKTPATTDVLPFGFDRSELPYENHTFEEVYCKSVLEHVKNLEFFVNEIHRVLKKNGRLYVLTDYAGYLPMYLFKSHEHNKLMKYDYISSEDHHYHLFVESHLRLLFKDFRDLKVSYILGGRNKLNKFLLSLLPAHMGCLHIVIEGRK